MDQELKDVENHEKFLARVRGRIAERKAELIDFAYDLAKYGHREQKRDDGTRYFEHCRESALILMDELGIFDPEMIMALLLHDMLEDNFLLTPRRIAIIFGEYVSGLVIKVTKPKKGDPRFADDRERHEFYFSQLAESSEWIKLLKLCDRLHNLRTLDSCAPEKRQRKIIETETVYLPLIDDLLTCRDPEVKAAGRILALEFGKILSRLKA